MGMPPTIWWGDSNQIFGRILELIALSLVHFRWSNDQLNVTHFCVRVSLDFVLNIKLQHNFNSFSCTVSYRNRTGHNHNN